MIKGYEAKSLDYRKEVLSWRALRLRSGQALRSHLCPQPEIASALAAPRNNTSSKLRPKVLSHGLKMPQAGFTVLELVVVLTLFCIFGSFAFLYLPPLLAQIRLNNGARQIATDLQVVRMKAIAQNRRFRVTFRPDNRDYVIDKEEGSSWIRLVLHGHAAESVADALIPLPEGVTIPTVNSGGDVIFVPRGHVDGGITVTLGSSTISDRKRVVVNLAGRIRIE